MALGASATAFAFEFGGLTGLLLGEDAAAAYSLASTGAALPAATGDAGGLGAGWIQASFFLFALAVPLALVLCVLALWAAPLTLRAQRRLLAAAEVLSAWSAMDVFVASVAVALLEISQFAAFIVGDKCDAVDALLRDYADDLLHGDDTCFDVQTSLRDGCGWLFAAAAVFPAIVAPLLRVLHRAVDERAAESRAEARPPADLAMTEVPLLDDPLDEELPHPEPPAEPEPEPRDRRSVRDGPWVRLLLRIGAVHEVFEAAEPHDALGEDAGARGAI